MGGGANRSMVQLMLELRENHDVNPIVLVPFGKLLPGDHGLVEECAKHNIQVERSIIPWFIHNKVWVQRIKYLMLFFYYPLLLIKLKKYKIQLIHSNGSVFDLGAWLSSSFKVPHIWHLREFGSEDETFKPVWNNKYIKKSYKKGDVFIAISDIIRKYYIGKVSEEKIIRIYNGISLDKYNLLAEHKNSITKFVIVGAVSQAKNQFDAVQASKLLIERNISNFHLTIVGQPDYKYEIQLKDYIEANQLGDKIDLLGLRNDVPRILQSMDVGLMLSRTEAFGRVTVEYMLQNLAVIASDTGANPEIIKDGTTGLIYTIHNPNELADKMERFIKDREYMLTIACNGNQYAREKFPSKKNSDAIFQVYKRFVKE